MPEQFLAESDLSPTVDGFGWRALRRGIQLAVGACAWGMLGIATLRAADPNAEFLAALREAGWNDTAVAYIDWVEHSPLMTAEFRQQAAFERAAGVAAQARASKSREERLRLMGEAAQGFERLAGEDPQAPAAFDALWQASSLYFELASMSLKQSKLSAGAASGAARTAAIEAFDRAEQTAGRLLEMCSTQLAALPKPAVAAGDDEVKAARDKLLNRQLETQYLLGLMSFEHAGVYEKGSDEHKEALDDAWTKFGVLVEQYRGKVVGESSRFYQGRCAQEQGDYAKALGCYEDLVDKPAQQDAFRRWAARAHRRRAECFIEQGKFDDAIHGCEGWLEASRVAEREQPEWLEVAYQLAAAYQAKLKKMPAGQAAAKRMESQVREIWRTVAAHPNDFQQDARVALAALQRNAAGGGDFKNFADALAGGKSALEIMNSSLMAAKVAKENNPEAVGELESEAAANKVDARRAFEAALELADRQTPIADLNAARYYLAWLFWEEGRIEEAAVLGEFVASRYPETEFGSGAAKIALAAWDKMYQESRTQGAAASGSSFLAKKLAELATLVATRWPDAPEAAPAVNILISTALRENRVDEAQQLLAKLPEAARAGAELSLGTAIWTQYLQATAGRDADFDEKTMALREQARKLLASGFAGARKQGEPSTSVAVGALYLAKLLLLGGDAAGAIDVLEDKAIGPLTLVTNKSPVAEQPAFVLETYMAALRAYLTSQPPDREKAQGVMQSLDDFAKSPDGKNAADQMTRLYVGLGLQLQKQVADLTSKGSDLQAQQVAAAFADVMDHVGARPGADWAIQNWIGQTNFQLSQGITGKEAERYLKRARDANQAVLAAAEKGGKGAPDADVVLGVRKRLGDCLIALKDFQGGITQYVKLLESKPRMLDVQHATAAAYQEWGATARKPFALEQAIGGAIPKADGNLVWGWSRLANAADGARAVAAASASSDPAAAQNAARFEDLFFEAHYNIARARYIWGTITPGQAGKDQLVMARQKIAQMQALYPKLGGQKWKTAFDTLLEQINAELKK